MFGKNNYFMHFIIHQIEKLTEKQTKFQYSFAKKVNFAYKYYIIVIKINKIR